MVDGYEYKQDIDMQIIAWHAANLMNVHLGKKHKVTVKKLLGKEKQMTQEQKEIEFDKFTAAMKIIKERRARHAADRGNIG